MLRTNRSSNFEIANNQISYFYKKHVCNKQKIKKGSDGKMQGRNQKSAKGVEAATHLSYANITESA